MVIPNNNIDARNKNIFFSIKKEEKFIRPITTHCVFICIQTKPRKVENDKETSFIRKLGGKSNRRKESLYSLSKVSVPECWNKSKFYLFISHSAVVPSSVTAMFVIDFSKIIYFLIKKLARK